VISTLGAAKFQVATLGGQNRWTVSQDLTGDTSANHWTIILDKDGLLDTHGMSEVEVSDHGDYASNYPLMDEWGAQYQSRVAGSWAYWNQAQLWSNCIPDWHEVVVTAYHIKDAQNAPIQRC
jgi:hypothetical protein